MSVDSLTTGLLTTVHRLIVVNRKLAAEDPAYGVRIGVSIPRLHTVKHKTWRQYLHECNAHELACGRVNEAPDPLRDPAFVDGYQRVVSALYDAKTAVDAVPNSAAARTLKAVFCQILDQEVYRVSGATDDDLSRWRAGGLPVTGSDAWVYTGRCQPIDARLLDDLFGAAQAVSDRPEDKGIAAGTDESRAHGLQLLHNDRARLSCNELATSYDVPDEALRKRLDRWRKSHHDGWVENTEAGTRAPRFLYEVSAVKHVIDDLKAADARRTKTSAKRPPKK